MSDCFVENTKNVKKLASRSTLFFSAMNFGTFEDFTALMAGTCMELCIPDFWGTMKAKASHGDKCTVALLLIKRGFEQRTQRLFTTLLTRHTHDKNRAVRIVHAFASCHIICTTHYDFVYDVPAFYERDFYRIHELLQFLCTPPSSTKTLQEAADELKTNTTNFPDGIYECRSLEEIEFLSQCSAVASWKSSSLQMAYKIMQKLGGYTSFEACLQKLEAHPDILWLYRFLTEGWNKLCSSKF